MLVHKYVDQESLAAKRLHQAVADPGFPRGGGANSPGGGAPTYDFAKISQKLHEIERIWAPGGACKILLCRSATARGESEDSVAPK